MNNTTPQTAASGAGTLSGRIWRLIKRLITVACTTSIILMLCDENEAPAGLSPMSQIMFIALHKLQAAVPAAVIYIINKVEI